MLFQQTNATCARVCHEHVSLNSNIAIWMLSAQKQTADLPDGSPPLPPRSLLLLLFLLLFPFLFLFLLFPFHCPLPSCSWDLSAGAEGKTIEIKVDSDTLDYISHLPQNITAISIMG